jgi:hypothetical protein
MEREWTIMVYMAGDNNLDSHGVFDLDQMKAVGSTPQVSILAQFDRRGHQRHTKRYEVQNYNVTADIDDDELGDLGETNTGDPDVLTDFVRWGINLRPAEKYMVIIWGHGSGTFDEDISKDKNGKRLLPRYDVKRHGIFLPLIKNLSPDAIGEFERSLFIESKAAPPIVVLTTLIAPDDDSKAALDNVKLKQALRNVGRQIHILGMDACLMSMTEVCHQVSQFVDLTVASQTEEELKGWPYKRFLRKLVNEPQATPAQLGQVIVEEYAAFYASYKDSEVTLSACNLQNHGELVRAVNRLSGSLIDNIDDDDVLSAIIAARYRVQSDEIIQTVDLCDLCELLFRNCKPAAIRTNCEEIINRIKSPNLIIANYAGTAAKYAFGLGIYFPTKRVAGHYERLDFVISGAPRWLEFLRAYLSRTLR